MIPPPFHLLLSAAAAADDGSATSDLSTSDSASSVSSVSISASSASSVSTSESKNKRKSYSLKYKREVIAAVHEMKKADKSITIAAAMATFGLGPSFYIRWKKTCLDALEIMSEEQSRVTVHGGVLKLHPGRPSVLEPERAALTSEVDELRDRGLPVTTRRVGLAAKKASPQFKAKTALAQVHIIQRFVRSLGYSHRASTHVAQKNYKETALLSTMFLDLARNRLLHLPDELKCNMDQTATPFCVTSKTTLQRKGTKTVHIMAAGEKMRCTTHIGIDMSGEMLTPFIIFKGMPGGRIERELANFPPDAYYAVQKNAWCDEERMLQWVATSFKDWVDMRKVEFPDIIPVLILDAFSCHMLGSVVNAVERLGCDVLYIPGGCTYLCQPVDVGINRPFKRELKRQWEDWVEDVGTDLQAPSRRDVAEWVITAHAMIPTATVKSAWKKTGFSWE